MTATTPTADDDKSSIEEQYIERLRGGARRIKADLEALADDLEAGDAEPEDVFATIEALAHTYVDVEDAAHTAPDCDFDAETSAVRAADQARKVQFHISRGSAADAITAAVAAAEYAEDARDGSGDTAE